MEIGGSDGVEAEEETKLSPRSSNYIDGTLLAYVNQLHIKLHLFTAGHDTVPAFAA